MTSALKEHTHGGPALTANAPAKTRAAAIRSFDPTDFPAITGREEEWRFTPIKRLRGLLDGVRTVEAAQWPAHEYGSLPAGVTVTRVRRNDPRLGSVLIPFDRMSAIAYQNFDTATVIQVAREAILPDPAVISVVGSLGQTPAYAHTFLDIGELAEATLVLDHTGPGMLADNVEIAVGAGARITLVTIADWAADAVQAQHVKFQLGRDAHVTHVAVSLGGSLVRQYTSVEFTDRGAEVDAYGLYFADTGQHLEHRLFIDHAVPDCRSNVVYRGALQGQGAHTVWVGDVLIQATAAGTDTYEVNRNLVLSDGARADSVPNLEIETGEVIGAGHASATGRFDDEQLFYLQARGIPADEARRLVVRGFFADLLSKIGIDSLAERLYAAIDERLTKAGT